MRGWRWVVAGTVAGALVRAGAGTSAAGQEIPPDSVTTVFRTDTVPGFGAVGGVATDALGYVYVADFRNTVWRIHPDGGLERFADGFYGASGNAVGPKGFLYQSSFYGNYVARISRTGAWDIVADEGLAGPVGIAAHPDGTLYVANCNGGFVAKVEPGGRVSEFSRSELFACPNGITLDDRGDLYVVSFNDTRIVRVSPDGTAHLFTDVPGGAGNGHIAFMRGAFYVTKHRANRIYRVTRDGHASVLAGTGAPGEDDGIATAATFTFPNGIAADPGGCCLWVNDRTEGQGLGRGHSLVTMRRIRLVSLADVLTAGGAAAGVDALREAYDAYHRSRPLENTSADAIQLGYRWLTSGRVAAAVALFEWNAAAYPADANAQFHCGEAYRYTGRPAEAAARYRRALELAPEHPQARARLAQVSRGAP